MLGLLVLAMLFFKPMCNAMLWTRQFEILFFVGTFRVYVSIMLVLVLPPVRGDDHHVLGSFKSRGAHV